MHHVPSCQLNLWFGHRRLLHLLLESGNFGRLTFGSGGCHPTISALLGNMHLSYCGNGEAPNKHVFSDKHNQVV